MEFGTTLVLINQSAQRYQSQKARTVSADHLEYYLVKFPLRNNSFPAVQSASVQ